MSFILNLESSTEVCSVSLAKDGELIDLIENHEGQNHASLLSMFAQDVIQRNQLGFQQLDAVAISKGPGSYTGLRIGVSFAKGICYGNNIPLIAISPLQAMAWHVNQNREKFGIETNKIRLLCPMIDARRMEVYTALYNNQMEEILPVNAHIIDKNSFSGYLKEDGVAFFGNGSVKCTEQISSPNALFITGVQTSAQFMCFLSNKAFENNDFVDLAYFEPFYLKDFIAGVPKKIF